MTFSRKINAVAATLALTACTVAVAAEAPSVGVQKTSRARTSPATFPFTSIETGERLPRGARIVFRDITLEGDQTVDVTMRAPAGKRIRSLAVRNSDDITGSYDPVGRIGRQRVVVELHPSQEGSGEVTGRLFALAR